MIQRALRLVPRSWTALALRARRWIVFRLISGVACLTRHLKHDACQEEILHLRNTLDKASLVLQESNERIACILESIADAFFTLNRDWRFTNINPEAERLLSSKRKDLIGRKMWEFFPDAPGTGLQSAYIKAMEENTPSQIEVFHAPLKKWFEVRIFPGHSGLSVYYRDITQRKRTQIKLHWELAVTAALSDLYKPLICLGSTIQDITNIVLDRAKSLTGSMHGYVSSIDSISGEVIGHTFTEMLKGACAIPEQEHGFKLLKKTDGVYAGLWGHSLNTGEAFFTNSPRSHPSYSGYPAGHIPIERFLSVPVMLEEKLVGQIALANPASDYTEQHLEAVRRLAEFYALAIQRKEAEDKTNNALRDKEILLREIHHRVKNNLQVISSLLNLQAGSLKYPRALEMLKESQNRVRSMAMVHEQLHRSRDFSMIHFGDYVRNLAASLFCSYGINSDKIGLQVNVGDASLAIDTAIPCGLIVHELISNSLKHAFPDGRTGEIRIGLETLSDGCRVLSVGDDGIGLPSQVDIGSTESLGLRLVRILADQIDATVTCACERGTQFQIGFIQNGNVEGNDHEQS